MVENGTSSSGNSHGRNLILVSTDVRDILLDPLKRSMLIPETNIWNSLALDG
jgi:hypothetical protein